MIAKLKHGNFQYTSKLEGMFKDVQGSSDLLRRFLQSDGRQFAGKLNLEVNVCTSGNWPRASGTEKPEIPLDLKNICDHYTTFYLREHKAHKLDWRMEKGTAEVMVKFNSQMRRILVVSTYQMMLLLIFNEAETSETKLSYANIESKIRLPKNVIGHHLLSLCHPSYKVLRKEPNSKNLDDDHLFYINPRYYNDSKKVSIPTMKPPAVRQEEVLAEEKAKKLRRQHQMDATIVRIMKTRKVMKHNDLLQDVIQQLQIRFRPQPSDIKKRVEALIDQEYLERLPEDRGSYKYLA